MKKLILLFAVLLLGYCTQAQVMSYTLNMATDSSGVYAGSGAGTVHYCTSPYIGSGAYNWTLELKVTASGTHATDSTEVIVEGSMDGTTYFKLTDLGTPWLGAYSVYYTVPVVGARLSATGAVGYWVWHPTVVLNYRYVRFKITQYKVLSVLTVNRAKLHLFAK